MSEYNVAFANTRAMGAQEGIITWTPFESKEEFDKFYTNDMKRFFRVIEEGISNERCIELVKQTPIACRIAAAIAESEDSETGEINQELLKFRLEMVKFATRNKN